MTETMKRMNAQEIAEFIKRMPDNSYIGIAAESVPIADENGKIVDYECTGWWSIAKLCYADSEKVIFDYYGGGYPYIYTTDGECAEDTVENAVENFFRDCADFGTLEEYFVVDTEVKSTNDSDFHYGVTVVIEYCYTNVGGIFEGGHTSRFIVSEMAQVKACCEQLYETFCEEFPIKKYPDRKFGILNIARDMQIDCAALTSSITE